MKKVLCSLDNAPANNNLICLLVDSNKEFFKFKTPCVNGLKGPLWSKINSCYRIYQQFNKFFQSEKVHTFWKFEKIYSLSKCTNLCMEHKMFRKMNITLTKYLWDFSHDQSQLTVTSNTYSMIFPFLMTHFF